MLVDEVEPEEAVAVQASGVAQAGEDVPGGGDGEEEQRAGEGFEATPVAEFTGEGQKEDGGGEEEDDGDQAFGEDGESEGDPESVGVEGGGSLCRLRYGSALAAREFARMTDSLMLRSE